jgi:hypothetical protein
LMQPGIILRHAQTRSSNTSMTAQTIFVQPH